MSRLSVNINKVATLRNARGGNVPNLVQVACDIESYGAEGITVHPRPDERHIRYADVYDLKKVVKTEFNIEGYPNQKFIDLVLSVQPHQVTLVPDPPGALTSNAGWDTKTNLSFLQDVISEFKNNGIRTSIFVDTYLQNIEYAKQTGTDRVELYTEPYAANYSENREIAISSFYRAALRARELGLELNAGHDLNLENIEFFIKSIPFISEVSIGHALICDAMYFGLENTVRMYLKKIKNASV